MLDEAPAAISDKKAAAELLAQNARPQLDQLLPPADTPAGSFLNRVRWLAGAMPDLALPKLDEDYLAEFLSDICFGLRSLDDVAMPIGYPFFNAALDTSG